MTNNEALHILRGLKRYYNDERYYGFYAGFDVEDNEAIDKAIKALEEIEIEQNIMDEINKIKATRSISIYEIIDIIGNYAKGDKE